jgi:putative membrane protein
LVLEMFLWSRPFGRRTFRADARVRRGLEVAGGEPGALQRLPCPPASRGACGSATLAAGVTLFFLACVVVAGVFGAATVSRKILMVQALPGAIALVLVWLGA